MWLVQHGLRLCAPRVMDSGERKGALLKTLVMLTTGASARYTDPALLMEILYIIKGWLVDGIAGPSAHSFHCPCFVEFTGIFLQRFADYQPLKGISGCGDW